MQKKILYVITKSVWGGAQRYVYDLATAFSQKGYTVSVATGGDGALVHRLKAYGIKTHNIQSFQRDVHLLKEISSFIALIRLLHKERPAILHLNSSKAGGLGALAGRIMRVPRIVFTSHGNVFNEEHRSLLERLGITFFSWLTFMLAHTVIVVSQADAQRCKTMPFLKKKIILIHNGIAVETPASRDTARQFLASHCHVPTTTDAIQKEIWIGTIAELHPNKGLSFLIDALALCMQDNTQLRCCIISHGEYYTKLAKQIHDHGLAHRIHLAGFVEHASHYLSAFNIVTLTSLKEGHPYTLLEAGQAGCCVVASNISGVVDTIIHKKTGFLVVPGDSTAIAEGITYCLDHPNEALSWGKNLYEKVRQEFNLEHTVQETLRIYD